jgi:hypothetical protein
MNFISSHIVEILIFVVIVAVLGALSQPARPPLIVTSYDYPLKEHRGFSIIPMALILFVIIFILSDQLRESPPKEVFEKPYPPVKKSPTITHFKKDTFGSDNSARATINTYNEISLEKDVNELLGIYQSKTALVPVFIKVSKINPKDTLNKSVSVFLKSNSTKGWHLLQTLDSLDSFNTFSFREKINNNMVYGDIDLSTYQGVSMNIYSDLHSNTHAINTSLIIFLDKIE